MFLKCITNFKKIYSRLLGEETSGNHEAYSSKKLNKALFVRPVDKCVADNEEKMNFKLSH